jgi:crotonobetainyl-CoA:carnitine CoA-transferase CaiB-like acyl-CoA transferase
VPRLSRTPGRVLYAGRRVGQDTRSVLGELGGYTGAELGALEADRIVWSPSEHDALS